MTSPRDISQDKPLLWLMAVACGLCAGANYYCQPLIHSIQQYFNVPESQVALTVTFAQVSYALGATWSIKPNLFRCSCSSRQSVYLFVPLPSTYQCCG